MNKLKDFYCNYKKIITAISIVLVFIISIIYLFVINVKEENALQNEVVVENEEKKSDMPVENTIKIDIKGRVKNPGVYILPENSRVKDAIDASGGLEEDAYTRYINLSKKLKDEDVIIINSYEEYKDILKRENKEVYCELFNDACIEEDKEITNDAFTENEKNIEEETKEETSDDLVVSLRPVNINTAEKEELMTLNGIGESKALSIIEYRNTVGLFKTKEEIMNVKGIGESVYAKIKENITT